MRSMWTASIASQMSTTCADMVIHVSDSQQRDIHFNSGQTSAGLISFIDLS